MWLINKWGILELIIIKLPENHLSFIIVLYPSTKSIKTRYSIKYKKRVGILTNLISTII